MRAKLYLECNDCDATLLAPTNKMREAIRWAEEQHQWVSIGQGGYRGFLCPLHEVTCVRCGHSNTTEQEIAARRVIRAEVAEKTATRRATR